MTYQKDYTTTYTINGHKYTVTAPALFDSETNQLLPDKTLDDQAAEIARQKYRNEMGLLSPEKIKNYRAKTGLSQRDLAELTGLSPNTIVLYEASAFPTKANNRMLKSLIANDAVLKQYLIDSKAEYSEELISKIEAYLNGTQSKAVSKRKPKFSAVQLTNWLRVENYFERDLNLNIYPLTQMKAIKLLYIAYGRYLATTQNKLFTAPIIHFQYGPLITGVHEKFKGKRVLDNDKPDQKAFADYNLVSQDKEIADLLAKVKTTSATMRPA